MTLALFLLALALIAALLWSIQFWSLSRTPYYRQDATPLIMRAVVRGVASELAGELGGEPAGNDGNLEAAPGLSEVDPGDADAA